MQYAFGLIASDSLNSYFGSGLLSVGRCSAPSYYKKPYIDGAEHRPTFHATIEIRNQSNNAEPVFDLRWNLHSHQLPEVWDVGWDNNPD